MCIDDTSNKFYSSRIKNSNNKIITIIISAGVTFVCFPMNTYRLKERPFRKEDIAAGDKSYLHMNYLNDALEYDDSKTKLIEIR